MYTTRGIFDVWSRPKSENDKTDILQLLREQ